MAEMELAISRPKRWDTPFDESMTPSEVDRLLRIEPFCSINPENFPPSTPLESILRNDTRLVKCEPGDLIVREGDYGNSAFLLLHGKVRVTLDSLKPSQLGRAKPPKPNLFRSLAQLWTNSRVPEARRAVVNGKAPKGQLDFGARQQNDQTRIFLQDVPRVLNETHTELLEPGEMFGEQSALSRTARTATMFAETKTVLLEIRWQGLRDLMKRSTALREHIDGLYRQNSLRQHLRDTPLFNHLSIEEMDRVSEATEFESYGNFDWHTSFASDQQLDLLERVAREPLIAEEGLVPSGLLLIRSGFARVSKKQGNGHQTVTYLSKGDTFGLTELVHQMQTGQLMPWEFSLRSVGYVDILRIPTSLVTSMVLPNLPAELLPPDPASPEQNKPSTGHPRVAARTLDFLVDQRIINGSQTMLVDLDRCTRCDDCVVACATTHDNNPRFIRHGPKHDNFMVSNSCMHCVDPVCMIGCPTGAIGRDLTTGIVRINDNTCIGCSVCAESCPYSNIRMVETRDTHGAIVIDEETGMPILKATKCDLCADQLGGPACQRACPHDALIRLDMGDHNKLGGWMNRRQAS